jgi:hypothetical protein
VGAVESVGDIGEVFGDLLGHAINTADLLAAIAERTDASHTMGTMENRDEKLHLAALSHQVEHELRDVASDVEVIR